MTFVGRPRHPITGRQLHLTAQTRVELDSYLYRVRSLRTDLKLGLRTVEQVNHELRHLRHGPVTLERCAVSYLARSSLAENTKRRVRSLTSERSKGAHLRSLLALPVASLDGAVLASWIEELAKLGLHPTTIAMIWRTLRALVRHGAERGWIGALPWGAWRPRLSRAPKKAPREATRTIEELARILFAARTLDEAEPALFSREREPMIACAAMLGLRQGELAGLRWSDLDAGPPVSILVARQWEKSPLKQGAQPTWIEAMPELGEILERHRERLARAGLYAPSGPIFPSRKSTAGRPRPYTAGAVLRSTHLRAAVRRANLPHVGSWSAHSLRDSFVTLEALATGGDLRRVATRSRHASIASLARYLRALSRDPAPPALLQLPTASTDGAKSPEVET